MGVRIEIRLPWLSDCAKQVTPFVGVRIEIVVASISIAIPMSLPSWECGLKSATAALNPTGTGHSLRGSAD